MEKEPKESISKEEGQRLKVFREMEGLSQEQLGIVLGRSQTHIGKFENGTRRIQIKDVKKLHLKFNMSYEWFYHNKGHMKFQPEKKTLSKDIGTTVSIVESKMDQLDAAVKQLYKDFKDAIPIK